MNDFGKCEVSFEVLVSLFLTLDGIELKLGSYVQLTLKHSMKNLNDILSG